MNNYRIGDYVLVGGEPKVISGVRDNGVYVGDVLHVGMDAPIKISEEFLVEKFGFVKEGDKLVRGIYGAMLTIIQTESDVWLVKLESMMANFSGFARYIHEVQHIFDLLNLSYEVNSESCMGKDK